MVSRYDRKYLNLQSNSTISKLQLEWSQYINISERNFALTNFIFYCKIFNVHLKSFKSFTLIRPFLSVFDSAIIDLGEDRKLEITLDTLRIFADTNRTSGKNNFKYNKCWSTRITYSAIFKNNFEMISSNIKVLLLCLHT